MITAGIDCGAKNTKTVILKNGKIIGKGTVLTGFNLDKAIKESIEAACSAAGISEKEIERKGGTGSGKDSIKGAVIINEIKAMARAAHFFFPGARAVADVGAEEGRAAQIDEHGNPVDFVINEKCAAGAGAFIEAMSRALETPIEEMGTLALKSDNEIPMNAQCVIFAESEVIGLIHANTDRADISRAIHDAIAGRIVSMVRRVGVTDDVVVMGGLAHNPAFIKAMETQLNIDKVHIPDDPEFGAAIGAAIAAGEKA
jgi:benzoyl-CoA reductase subunit D